MNIIFDKYILGEKIDNKLVSEKEKKKSKWFEVK